METTIIVTANVVATGGYRDSEHAPFNPRRLLLGSSRIATQPVQRRNQSFEFGGHDQARNGTTLMPVMIASRRSAQS